MDGCTIRLFKDNLEVTSVVMPSDMVDIKENIFRGCVGLTQIILPENVKYIREGAFKYCGLKNITLPKTIEVIYQKAFAGCGLEEVKVLAETPPFASDNTFSNYNIPLYVPESAMSSYQTTSPWSKFSSFKTLSGEDIEKKKCATPTISYNNGQLTFGCETEGVEYNSTITDADINTYKTAVIQLGVTYNISVYATKDGYENSEVATATLCWVDTDPKKEGDISGIAEVAARAVLVKTSNGFLTVEGLDDHTQVRVYTVDGKQAGSATSHAGVANVATNINPGSIAIVKIGDKAMKVMVK